MNTNARLSNYVPIPALAQNANYYAKERRALEKLTPAEFPRMPISVLAPRGRIPDLPSFGFRPLPVETWPRQNIMFQSSIMARLKREGSDHVLEL